MKVLKGVEFDNVFINPQKGALLKVLQQTGRLPPVAIRVTPLEASRKPFFSNKFIQYSFSSSVIIPVDTFSFTVAMDESGVFTIPVREGDIINLYANEVPLTVGIIDSVRVQTTSQGTTITIDGRDLLGQLEDQNAVSTSSNPIYAGNYTIDQVIATITKDTRIKSTPIKNNASSKAWLFATQPGETKLSALQRYCEGLNILFWMSPDGRIIIGKPSMYGQSLGRIFLQRAQRISNVLSMSSTRASTSIPNMIAAIWNGQESVQSRIGPEQMLKNASRGPARLLNNGHIVPRAVIVSTPQGGSPQDLSDVNVITSAGGSNLLQAYAKREIARENIKELQVQAQVVGHYNEMGNPYMPNQVYRCQYDIDGVDEDMFLYQVEYTCDNNQSQRTNLFFCRQNAIVADVRVV